MFFYPRSQDRPFHHGPYPLESLARDETVIDREANAPALAAPPSEKPSDDLVGALGHYKAIFSAFTTGETAPAKAPLPDDLMRRAQDVKGGAYFMNADTVGICKIPENAWYSDGEKFPHDHALVILVAAPRQIEKENLAHGWTEKARGKIPELRAAEIALTLAGHIATMGFSAQAHYAGTGHVDMHRLAVLAGLVVRQDETLEAPFIGTEFALSVVTTDYEISTDVPLASDAINTRGLAYWWGINGAVSGRERNAKAKRPTHLGRYPMETVKRVERPTTLILDDEIPRVPKRAAFFQRALHGDLGDKAKKERTRFSFKTPFSHSLLNVIRSMVPHQDGDVGELDEKAFGTPKENTEAIKSLAHALGADLAGICEVPRYAWFSHKEDGTEIPMYHRYAVVMLIDQGFETMEGASGDDWASGAQSMRAYLRGAEIAGVMAEFLRRKGVSARPQTNADSDVLQIPLILWAGLGELSRIGELVLNPFVGPRLKSVVMTTDLPLEVDKPIEFGLQYFCSNCLKCARECPCDAIPFGDKV
ncbi:MAG: Fe-S protein, partial [Hyphomicrobiales bacterium]